jgi:chemotaxis protein methyltransferase CheR
VGESEATDTEFEILKATIQETMGFFPERYKERPLKRRIAVRMRHAKTNSYLEYADILKQSVGEQQLLHKTLTINVSKFFRNRSTFQKIENDILPRIVKEYEGKTGLVKVWCAGCATGEEVYTMAMLLDTFFRSHQIALPFTVIGTDIDIDSLKHAEKGCYRSEMFDEIPKHFFNTYIEKGERFCVREELKSRVQFLQLDLEEENSKLEDLDLVLFRNVLIYMRTEFQEKVLLLIHRRLCKRGFLVLGKVEMLIGDAKNLFTIVDSRERIYRKCQVLER